MTEPRFFVRQCGRHLEVYDSANFTMMSKPVLTYEIPDNWGTEWAWNITSEGDIEIRATVPLQSLSLGIV